MTLRPAPPGLPGLRRQLGLPGLHTLGLYGLRDLPGCAAGAGCPADPRQRRRHDDRRRPALLDEDSATTRRRRGQNPLITVIAAR